MAEDPIDRLRIPGFPLRLSDVASPRALQRVLAVHQATPCKPRSQRLAISMLHVTYAHAC